MGEDYGRYLSLFEKMSPALAMEENPGFRYPILFLREIGISARLIFLIIAGLNSTLMGSFILYNAKYRFPALLIYYALYMAPFGCNAVAQGLSTSVMLYAVRDIRENRFWKVLLLTGIAMSIHMIGVFLLVIYAAYRLKMTLWNLLLFLAVLCAVSYGVSLFLYNGALMKILPDSYQDLFNLYTRKYMDSVDIVSLAARIVMLGLVSLPLLKYDETERKIYLIYFLSFLFYLILMRNSLLGTRVNLSLKIMEMALAGNAIGRISPKVSRIALFCMMSLFWAMVLLSAMRYPELYPYHTWLFGV